MSINTNKPTIDDWIGHYKVTISSGTWSNGSFDIVPSEGNDELSIRVSEGDVSPLSGDTFKATYNEPTGSLFVSDEAGEPELNLQFCLFRVDGKKFMSVQILVGDPQDSGVVGAEED